MKFGNLPEVVKYIEFGKEHMAFPIASRDLEHHTGENNEPLLSLVFVKPVLDPLDPEKKKTLNLAGTVNESQLVQIRHDVAHESHAFTPEQIQARRDAGFSTYPGNQIPGGRWRELSSDELDDLAANAESREADHARAKAAKQADEEAKKKLAEKNQAEQDEASKTAASQREADAIEREAKIRNKQEELKNAKPAEEPVAVAAGDPPAGGEGTGSVN